MIDFEDDIFRACCQIDNLATLFEDGATIRHCRDDCLNRMVPSDLRDIVRRLVAALDEIERIEKRDSFDDLIADAKSEAITAMRKFPQPNYVISKVAEEAGEVVKTAIHCAEGRDTPEELRGEIKQLIAMLYRLWVEGDEVHGLPAVRAALAGPDQ